MILEFAMRGIQSVDHLNGCNKRISKNRKNPTLNTTNVLLFLVPRYPVLDSVIICMRL